MSSNSLFGRGLLALVLAATTLGSLAAPASSAEPRGRPAVDQQERDLPQALSLLAPFTCGTEWRGTTYGGHGANDWNLDLNRSGGDHAADVGQPVLAQADGVVVWFKEFGYNNRAGTYIEIDYGDVTVRYIHLIEGSIPTELAEIGAEVRSGDTIGLLGAAGHVTGPHLHLEYWDSAGYDDTAWYQLPRSNHLPVAFDGQVMVAQPGRPTPTFVSTNCSVDPKEHRLRALRLWRYAQLDETAD